MLVDIDRLEDMAASSRLFSLDRFNLFSFYRRDHGARDGSSLRQHINGILTDAGHPVPHRVKLLCYPRILGYVFNPLSVYYCYDADGQVSALVYQVHNTFGDVHSYVAPVSDTEVQGRVIHQARDKNLHVSPFVGMAARYHFALDNPSETIGIRIRETDEDGPFLLATFDGKAREFTTASLVAAFVRYPLMTLKIIGAIHYEALRLWLKGVPFFSSPPQAPPRTSYDGPARGSRGNAIDPAKAPEKRYTDSGNPRAA